MYTISIITVVYNGAATLRETIESIFSQTYPYIEFILIDGGSSDGTVDIIKKYDSKIAFWISEKDKGIYDAMNKGVKKATGDWIYFLGADDILYSPGTIEQLVAKFRSGNTLYYGNAIFKTSGRVYDGYFSRYKLCLRNISHQAIFYPRAVFEQRLFDVKYRIKSDYHFNLLCFGDKNWRFEHINQIISIFNDSATSASQEDLAFEQEKLLLVKQHIGLGPYLYAALRRFTKRVLSTR